MSSHLAFSVHLAPFTTLYHVLIYGSFYHLSPCTTLTYSPWRRDYSSESCIHLKCNFSKHLLNGFLIHKDTSLVHIFISYVLSFFFPTVPTIKPLYIHVERKEVILFISLFSYLGVNNLPPFSWGEWNHLSQSFTQLPHAMRRQVSKGCKPFLQFRKPYSSMGLAPHLCTLTPELSPPRCQNCSQGRILQKVPH